MCVPLCTVALTDIYKLPSDGGSGSSHINHCVHQVPHFSQAPRLLLLIFFSPLTEVKGHFFCLLKRNVFANNSKSVLCVCFFSLCSQCDFCWFYFSNTCSQILCSYSITPFIKAPTGKSSRAACVISWLCLTWLCVHGKTFFPLFQAQ